MFALVRRSGVESIKKGRTQTEEKHGRWSPGIGTSLFFDY